jgi:hypothetical protein
MYLYRLLQRRLILNCFTYHLFTPFNSSLIPHLILSLLTFHLLYSFHIHCNYNQRFMNSLDRRIARLVARREEVSPVPYTSQSYTRSSQGHKVVQGIHQLGLIAYNVRHKAPRITLSSPVWQVWRYHNYPPQHTHRTTHDKMSPPRPKLPRRHTQRKYFHHRARTRPLSLSSYKRP